MPRARVASRALHQNSPSNKTPFKKKGRSRVAPPLFLLRDVSLCYLMILRATRPPATNRAPAPSANSDAAPLPPVFGSSFGGGGGGGGAGGGGGGAAFGA